MIKQGVVSLSAVTAIAAAALALPQAQAPVQAGVKPQDPVAASAYPARPLWGDTHLHTANSFDAFTAGNRLGPEEALRFAQGEEVTSSTGIKAKLDRPLDFLVIADHSNNLGSMTALYNTPEDQLDDPVLKRWRKMIHEGGEAAGAALREIIVAGAQNRIPKSFSDPAVQKAQMQRTWTQHVETVERHNRPGVFTAMFGFEWTLAPNTNTQHRVVIFRDGSAKVGKVLPLPVTNKETPRALWDYMDRYETATGGQVLAIPHNPNQSNGTMFMMTDWDGGAITAELAARRAAHEPVAEVTQYKGDSESHPFLSPNDEFADFGDQGWDLGNGQLTELKKPEMLTFEYVREALKRGLAVEARTGVNPYRLGMIGSTDSHTSLSTAREDNWFGKVSLVEPSARRMAEPLNPGKDPTRYGWHYLAGGMAAVWAAANTREAIFDALLRREVYATTGPRMTVRLFGGNSFAPGVFRGDWVKAGYSQGVPMGGRLPSGKKAPSFIVQALKDPIGANLDRIQIVKGWVEADGTTKEKIYDVAWSSPSTRKRGKDGRLTPVGDTVDLANATYANSIGAPELKTVWRDPDFKPGQRAFYYARVLEIPTPRWVLFDAIRFKVKPPKDARLKDQERAYTSPIWVG